MSTSTPIKKLSVALLLDSFVVATWQRIIIAEVLRIQDLGRIVVFLNGSPARASQGNKFVYRLLRRLDRALFGQPNDCFGREDIRHLLKDAEVYNVAPLQGRYTDEFPPDVLEPFRGSLDVILRFGFRVLKGDILMIAKHGVWSLHHGDNDVNRGGPPGFWEVYNREAVTGVTLLQLTETLDGGRVLAKAFVRTDVSSFNRNQNTLFWAGVELFCNAMRHLAATEGMPAGDRAILPLLYSGPLYRDPGNLAALKIGFVFFVRRLRSWLTAMVRSPQWRLLYRFAKNGLPAPTLYSFKNLKPPSHTDWADPFVHVVGKRYFVFIEEFIKSQKNAHISCIEFTEHGPVSNKPVVVLREDHHLSYPFVFDYGGKHYMIPERGASGKVCLYEAENFPSGWKLKTVLIENEIYDATIIEHEGIWFLFGTGKPFAGNSPHQYLYIYHAADPIQGTWTLHPKSPVSRTVIGARPAGRIFRQGDKLIRPGQIGAPRYGYGITFFEIIRLTLTEYEERPLHDILPNFNPDVRAVHTFNRAGNLTVLDAQFR